MAIKRGTPVRTSVGEMLTEEFLKPMDMTAEDLAIKMGYCRHDVNDIVDDASTITADDAIALGKAFKMSPEFWLNVRNAYDLWLVQVVQADEKARRRGRSR